MFAEKVLFLAQADVTAESPRVCAGSWRGCVKEERLLLDFRGEEFRGCCGRMGAREK